MAFPESVVFDDFAGSNLNPLNGTTGFHSGVMMPSYYTGNCQRVSNRGAASSGAGSVVYDHSLSRASNSVECAATAIDNGDFDRVLAAMVTDRGAGFDGYILEYNDGNVELLRYTGGSPTLLDSFSSAGIDGQQIGMLLEPGGNIIVHLDGTPQFTVSDSTWMSGDVGWAIENSVTYWDNIYWAELVTSAAPQLLTSATSSGLSMGSSRSISMPASIEADDILIALVTADNPSSTEITAAGDWVRLAHLTQGSNAHRLAYFCLLAAGSDTLSVSGPSTPYAAFVGRFQNLVGFTSTAELSNVLEDLWWDSTSSSGNVDPAEGTIDADPTTWLAVAALDGEAVTAPPSGYTIIANVSA